MYEALGNFISLDSKYKKNYGADYIYNLASKNFLDYDLKNQTGVHVLYSQRNVRDLKSQQETLTLVSFDELF